MPLADRKLVQVNFCAATVSKAYKREAYDAFDYLGDLGGIFEIVHLLAFFLTAKIIKRLYYAALVSKTYAIQHYDKNFDQYY